MKRYDLMHSINARGTFLCSKVAIPYLKKSKNPHILMNSPPLSMNPIWFKSHVAYTVAKYNMSMFALGLAAELREFGIAVNALWPKTAIDTEAITLISGEEFRKKCRRPEIMADAAYAILTQDSRACTGNFFVDEYFLKQQGVTDFDQYAVVPGTTDLMLDFFLDDHIPELERRGLVMRATSSEKKSGNTTAKDSKTASSSGGSDVAQVFENIKKLMTPELMKKISAIYAFDLQGEQWYLDMKNDSGSAGQGEPPSGKAQCTMKMSKEDFQSMFAGKLKPAAAFMGGKLKIQGDIATALKLEQLLNQMLKSKL